MDNILNINQLKKDFSISAVVAGLIVVLVGMTSSAVIVFQAASAFGVSGAQAGSWLGSLCIGMGILGLYFSIKYKAPVMMAWSTPGAVLLVTAAQGVTLSEAIGAFLFSGLLVFVFGITGWFEKIMKYISVSLTSALFAGVLFHFCLDAFSAIKLNPVLVGSMFGVYLFGRKFLPRMNMLFVLITGIFISFVLGLFQFNQVHLTTTEFHFIPPQFSWISIISIGIPLFVVTMASQNLTGISVMRNYDFNVPISPIITGIGIANIISSFFGGFKINLAAITAAIAMGPEAHEDKSRRYIAALVSAVIYILIGLFAGTVTSLFAAFPAQMIAAIAGFALLGPVSAGLEKALVHSSEKEAAFITFIIAVSGISFLGISSAFWAIVIGSLFQLFLKTKLSQK